MNSSPDEFGIDKAVPAGSVAEVMEIAESVAVTVVVAALSYPTIPRKSQSPAVKAKLTTLAVTPVVKATEDARAKEALSISPTYPIAAES